MEKSSKFHIYLFEDVFDSVKKKREPDECELKVLSNTWMLMGMLLFIIIGLGRMITDTLSVQGVLVCSIPIYNEFISLIFELAMLSASFIVLSQGVCHWQVLIMMIAGLSVSFTLPSVFMDLTSSAWPFCFWLPLFVVLLITMEIVYRKGRNVSF